MIDNNNSPWILIGKTSALKTELEALGGLKEAHIEGRTIVTNYYEVQFGVLNNKCNPIELRFLDFKLKIDRHLIIL